jgi:ribosomal protein S18 acetylase RimI-like enzyme
MDEWHPVEPHWYLFAIGVDQNSQGEGLGSILLEYALSKCDADGKLAYLESSNPRNVPFYQRHGFEVTRVIQIGTSPTFTLMTRDPR